MQLTLSDGISAVTVWGDTVQHAQKRCATPDDVRRQLEKLGETPFVLSATEGLNIQLEDGAFLPVSSLNDLRRNGTEALRNERVLAFDRQGRQDTLRFRTEKEEHRRQQVQCTGNPAAVCAGSSELPAIAVVFSSPEEAPALKEAGADVLIFEPLNLAAEKLDDALDTLPDGCMVQLPPQISQASLKAALDSIRAHADKLTGVVAGCVGQIGTVQGLPVWAGPGIPVTNRKAVDAVCALPVEGFLLWMEWSGEELLQLRPFPKPAYLKVYGREILMLLNHCPERAARGLTKGRNTCGICRENGMACGMKEPFLTDQKGYRFPLQRQVFPEGCVLRVLGALPTDLRTYRREILQLGTGMLLQFTTETTNEKISVIKAFDSLRNGSSPDKPSAATAGYWKRSVE